MRSGRPVPKSFGSSFFPSYKGFRNGIRADYDKTWIRVFHARMIVGSTGNVLIKAPIIRSDHRRSKDSWAIRKLQSNVLAVMRYYPKKALPASVFTPDAHLILQR
jgi:hypothetical protein